MTKSLNAPEAGIGWEGWRSNLPQLLILAAIVGAAAYARALPSPLIETLRHALSLSDTQLAILQGPAQAWPLLVLSVPIGLIIDRKSRVRFLQCLGLLIILGTILTAAAHSFWAIVGARCMVGVGTVAILMTFASLLADLFGPTQRGRAGIIVAFSQNAGQAAAFQCAGFLVVHFASSPNAWRLTMLIASVPLAVSCCIALRLREPTRKSVVEHPSILSESLREAWRHRRVIAPLLAGTVMVAIADQSVLVWGAPTLSRVFGLAADRAGSMIASALLLCGIIAPLLGGFLADTCQRIGGPKMTISALALVALLSVPAAAFAIVASSWAAVGLLIVFITLGGIIGVSITPLATVVIPNEIRGLSLALIYSASAIIGLGAAPLLVSIVAEHVGGPTMLGRSLALISAGSSLCGALVFALGRKAAHDAATRPL